MARDYNCNNYFQECENIDASLLHDFVNKTNLFKEIKQNEYGDKVDFLGTDKNDRPCMLEIKRRKCNIQTYSTIYIETEKYWSLIQRWRQFNFIPLYVNFMDNGVLIFDLKRTEPDKMKPKLVNIWNGGYKQNQEVWRYELPREDAITFYNDENNGYKLIHDGKKGKAEQRREDETY